MPSSDDSFDGSTFSLPGDLNPFMDDDTDSPELWDLYEPELEAAPGLLEDEVVADVEGSGEDAGSNNVIVLTGPRSGLLVHESTALESTHAAIARPVKSATEALGPGEVLMIAHQPGNYAATVPGTLARIHADFSATGLSLGISARLPRKGVTATATYLEKFGAAAVRIADPEGYALPTDWIADPPLSDRQAANVGYGADAPEQGEQASSSWNIRVVRAQRAAGANLLLTPGRSISATNGATDLADANRALDDLLEEVRGDEVPGWNLSLPAAWLTDSVLREQLLAELVDREEVNVWHLRVRWPLIKKSYGQTLDPLILAGYKEIAETARREDKALLLPTTGLTGWITLGWGSVGFGTGGSNATQSWADHPRIASRKGVSRATVNRYHSGPLLHTITADSHSNLLRSLPEDQYRPCNCAYCEQLSSALVWQPQIAASHALYTMGRLAAEVAAHPRRSRKEAIASIVQSSHSLNENIPISIALDTKEAPDHLEVWRQVLAN